SSGTLSVAQGATSPGISVSIAGENGFTGNVQVTLDGLPGGVTSSPASPFSAAAGSNTTVLFTALTTAPTGNFTVAAQGTDGKLSHSANLSLTIQAGVASGLPRTAFVRTDSVAALDNPPGEAAHRHVAFDASREQVFVANRAMNRVEVMDAATLARKAHIA